MAGLPINLAQLLSGTNFGAPPMGAPDPNTPPPVAPQQPQQAVGLEAMLQGAMPTADQSGPRPDSSEVQTARQFANDQIRKSSVADDLLMGMIKKMQSPEDMSGGAVARNALSNWARGALMGPNFVSAQQEEADKKRKDMALQLNAVQLKASEEKNAKLQALQMLTAAQRDDAAQEHNRIAEQNAQTALEKVRNDKGYQESVLGLKKALQDAQIPLFNAKTGEVQANTKKTEYAATTLKYLSEHPELQYIKSPLQWGAIEAEAEGLKQGTPEYRKAVEDSYGRFQSMQRLSKFAPQYMQLKNDVGLSPEALDYWAKQVDLGRQVPRLTAQNMSVMVPMMEAAAREGDPINFIQAKALGGALTKNETTKTMVGSFENAAGRNLTYAEQLSDEYKRGKAPLFNKYSQWVSGNLTGDPELARFYAATQTAVNEYAKVVTSNGASGVAVSDKARDEINKMLSTVQNMDQFKSAIEAMRVDMKNRISGFNAENDRLHGVIKGLSGTKKAAPATPVDDSGFKVVESRPVK